MKPTAFYCYDAYCGWCYGFSPVITRLSREYADRADFEALSGGMIPQDSARHIGHIAGFILSAYRTVEEHTGIRFGEDFLWHVRNPERSDWFPHSGKAAAAMVILKEFHPERSIDWAAALQHALYAEGRDLTDDEAYRHLLPSFGLTEEAFYGLLNSPEYREKADYEQSLVRQLQVTGFPALLLQTGELRFQLLASGYTDFDTVKGRLDSALEATSR